LDALVQADSTTSKAVYPAYTPAAIPNSVAVNSTTS
jgi:hypothetical protein